MLPLYDPAQARPRRSARLRPPTTFNDLPDDLLPHILALLPQKDCFRAALACRALARAARPPSAVWADITLTDAQLRKPATVARLLPSLRLAGHSLKRMGIEYYGGTPAVESLRSILEVAVPHLSDLTFVAPSYPNDLFMRSVRGALASASRLTRLILNDSSIIAPCRLPGQAWADAATVEFALGLTEQRLRQAAVIAAAAAPAGARLATITGMDLWLPEDVEAVDAFASVAGAGLTHLSLTALDDLVPALAAVIARLPALVELVAGCAPRRIYGRRGAEDPRGVVDPDLTALTSPSLERLAIITLGASSVRVADALDSRLGELVLTGLASLDPPAIFRGGGGSARFTRLTRLEYGLHFKFQCVDLGPWSTAELSVPTLVELSVAGRAFTPGGRDGRAWAVAVVRETLPRLARLELLYPRYRHGVRPTVRYACRRYLGEPPEFGFDCCCSCGAEGGCADGREVERALCEALPAAAAEAGRRLVVVSDRRRTTKWWMLTEEFTLHFEATPPGG